MNARRVWTETKRELTRPGTAWLLAIGLLLAWGSARLFAVDGSVRMHLALVDLIVPLGLVPLGARLAARDRERGFAAVLGTSPITPGDVLAGRALHLALFLALHLALTAPVAWLLLSPLGGPVLEPVASFALWGIVVGLASLATGLLVGNLVGPRSTLGLSLAFLVAFAWFLFGTLGSFAAGALGTFAGRDVVLMVSHASPLTWAFDALDLHGAFSTSASTSSIWLGVLVLTGALTGLTVVVATRLQGVDGWRPVWGTKTFALGAVALMLVAATGAVAAWDHPAEPKEAGLRFFGAPISGPGFELFVGTSLDTSGGGGSEHFIPVAFGSEQRLLIRFHMQGEPLVHYAISSVRVEAAGSRVVAAGPPPTSLDADDQGFAQATMEIRVTVLVVDQLDGDSVPIATHVTVNGVEGKTAAGYLRVQGPGLSNAALLAMVAAVVVPLLALVWVLPRRLNRW